MKNKINVLIKKEVFELCFNIKSWLNVIVWAAIPYLSQITEPYHRFILALLFSIFAGGQYIYDSCLNDIKLGSSIFLHNIQSRVLTVFCIKLVISGVLSGIAMLINIPHIVPYINFFDIFWIAPMYIFFAALMYLASVFSKCAEITSAVISIVAATAIFALIIIINYLVLKIIFSIVITCFFVFISIKILYSKIYRTQL
ncbi:hypothetical protein [Treponema pedis]|uniref:hypothetical protein n=1 Tax=Treponema pedis TaxID=409322 RepID=UPI003D1DC2C7